MKTLVRATVLLALVGAADLAGQERRYGLEVSTPAAEGLDTAKLRGLVARAKETNSSALVILKNGKLVFEWYGLERQPIDAIAITPSVVSMLVGQLIDARKLDLDTPVSAFYPEWKEGRAGKITVRHLLNHTSGLRPDPSPEELTESGDYVGMALKAEVEQEPGSFLRYNNNALNLLAGLASVAAGQGLDDFARTSLFQPLGITEFSWTSDNLRNSLGMTGLKIHAVDLAKLGQLMLNGGLWNGKRIISSDWVTKSLEPGQPLQVVYGFLWRLYYDRGQLWFFIDQPLLDQWKARGVPEVHVKQFAQLLDTLMLPRNYNPLVASWFPASGEYQRFRELLVRHGVMEYRMKPGRRVAFWGNGTLGQYVVAYPEHNLVVVRQIHSTQHRGPDDSFSDFMNVVYALTQP